MTVLEYGAGQGPAAQAQCPPLGVGSPGRRCCLRNFHLVNRALLR